MPFIMVFLRELSPIREEAATQARALFSKTRSPNAPPFLYSPDSVLSRKLYFHGQIYIYIYIHIYIVSFSPNIVFVLFQEKIRRKLQTRDTPIDKREIYTHKQSKNSVIEQWRNTFIRTQQTNYIHTYIYTVVYTYIRIQIAR